MKHYICDICGVRIGRNDLRYVLKMNIFAAYDTMEIDPCDLEKDYEEEIKRLVADMKRMDPKQLEEDVFKHLNFDLCRACQQRFITNPLPHSSAADEWSSEIPPFDADDFLRRIRGA